MRCMTSGSRTYHDLAEYRENEVLHVAIAGIGDNEDEAGDGVLRRGLNEHGGD